MNEIANTIMHLRLCQAARDAGYPVSFTTDPTWLVQQAINRRGGWPDDPSSYRGSAMPIRAHAGLIRRDSRIVGSARFVSIPSDLYVCPRKAIGETFNHLRLLARRINTPRLTVRESELGEWRLLLMTRIPDRITEREDRV